MEYRPIRIDLELDRRLTDVGRKYRLTKRAITEFGLRLMLDALESGDLDPAKVAGYTDVIRTDDGCNAARAE